MIQRLTFPFYGFLSLCAYLSLDTFEILAPTEWTYAVLDQLDEPLVVLVPDTQGSEHLECLREQQLGRDSNRAGELITEFGDASTVKQIGEFALIRYRLTDPRALCRRETRVAVKEGSESVAKLCESLKPGAPLFGNARRPVGRLQACIDGRHSLSNNFGEALMQPVRLRGGERICKEHSL